MVTSNTSHTLKPRTDAKHLQPHADAALFSAGVSRRDAYEQVKLQLTGLLDGQREWPSEIKGPANALEGRPINQVCNLANAASLLWALFHALPEPHSRINWAGFYVRSDLFPTRRTARQAAGGGHGNDDNSAAASAPSVELLLAPFAGLPACQSIPIPAPGSARAPGVCAAAFIAAETQVVPDVEKRPGHIACDAKTRSEIVIPIVRRRGPGSGSASSDGGGAVVGVLDIDCEVEDAFDELDQAELGEIADMIAQACDW